MWILLQFNYTLKALTGQPFWATRSCFYLGLSATAPYFGGVTGLEGDCADQIEAKTSQCDVSKERATQFIAMLTPQQTSRNISHYKNNCHLDQR